MFSGADDARRAFRRAHFYRRCDDGHLLPANLPHTALQGEKCAVFRFCRRGRGSWFPPLFAVPSGVLSGDARMDGEFRDSFSRAAIDQRKSAGRWRAGRLGEPFGREFTPLAPAVCAASRRAAEPDGADAAMYLWRGAAKDVAEGGRRISDVTKRKRKQAAFPLGRRRVNARNMGDSMSR